MANVALEKTNDRNIKIDLIKTVAIICVCYCHYGCSQVSSQDMSPMGIIKILMRLFACTAVPAFFMVNGALCIPKEYSMEKSFHKAIDVLIKLGIYIPVTLIGYELIANGNLLDVKTLLIRCWYWQGNGAQHLWFLFALLTLYFLYPFILFMTKQNKHIRLFYIAMLVVFTFGNAAINIAHNLYGHFWCGGGIYHSNTNFFLGVNFYYGWYSYPIVYFLLGNYISKRVEKQKRLSKLQVIAIILLMILATVFYIETCKFTSYDLQDPYYMMETWGYNQPFMLIIVAGLFGFVMRYVKVPHFLEKIISVAGSNTLGILFFHRFVGEFVRKIYAAYGIDLAYPGLKYGLLSTVIVFTVGLALTAILKRITIFKRIF